LSEQLPELIVVVGPTATGKSTLAARLARHLGGEVVSADSVQVYRHFDVGSGKPSAEELALAPHHLIDVADPNEPMEAQVWAQRASDIILGLQARGVPAVVCGGTFLWIRALLFGLANAPPGDAQVRARHQQMSASDGRSALHARLAEIDPDSARKLHPNDFVRVSRALEVHELTGRTMSEVQAEHGFRQPRFAATLLRLAWEPSDYERRLAERVSQMVRDGFREEVSRLLAQGYGQARAMEAVGYRQVRDAVLGVDAGSLTDDELVLQIIRVTRVFARRQRTWLRDEPVRWVDPSLLSDDGALHALAESLRS
jgi:tRNA dimethylallyltransferase